MFGHAARKCLFALPARAVCSASTLLLLILASFLRLLFYPHFLFPSVLLPYDFASPAVNTTARSFVRSAISVYQHGQLSLSLFSLLAEAKKTL